MIKLIKTIWRFFFNDKIEESYCDQLRNLNENKKQLKRLSVCQDNQSVIGMLNFVIKKQEKKLREFKSSK